MRSEIPKLSSASRCHLNIGCIYKLFRHPLRYFEMIVFLHSKHIIRAGSFSLSELSPQGFIKLFWEELEVSRNFGVLTKSFIYFPNIDILGVPISWILCTTQITLEAVQRVGSDISRKLTFFTTRMIFFKLLQMK